MGKRKLDKRKGGISEYLLKHVEKDYKNGVIWGLRNDNKNLYI